MGQGVDGWQQVIAGIYQAESGRVLASLIKLLGDFDLAEEALHDAFAEALRFWPERGLPDNPRAWLVSAGRFKVIDRLRRRARFNANRDEIARRMEAAAEQAGEPNLDEMQDDYLRLVFTCCHPVLPPDAQVALTLRSVCGLTTEEIASAFVVPPPTLAQRIVRAKARIREAQVAYDVPEKQQLAERLDAVLRVVYLVFNEGYSPSSGAAVTRLDLTAEAIRLGRLLVQMLPEPEVQGLLALMLLQNSRRDARLTPEGDLVLLPDQDRGLWDRGQIAEANAFIERAFASRRIGTYTLQAAIAARHAAPATAGETDWGAIVGLYDILRVADPSPIVDLNHAVALAMRDGPAEAVEVVEALSHGALAEYAPAHAAHADLLRRLGRSAEARAAYARALELAQQAPERRFLLRRLQECDLG